MLQETYHIKLNQFEGPFDLLLFFIHRDDLDINNIPIHKITHDFLDYIHQMEKLNMELASEFILFAAILIKIKSSSILPRKPLDEQGNEIDTKTQLQERLIEYKKIKKASTQLSDMEEDRKKFFSKGNYISNVNQVSDVIADNSEIESVTSYRLLKSFERVLIRFTDKHFKPIHNVVRYHYESKDTRSYLLEITDFNATTHFENIFSKCENRFHAIYVFLSLLELIEEKYLEIIIGHNINDFYVKKKTEDKILA